MINKTKTINKIRFTKEGYAKLKEEYNDLLRQRPLAVEDLKKAREMGDLSENGYYKESRLKLNFIDGRLRRFSDYLRRADIIDTDGTRLEIDTVYIGSTVTLSDGKSERTYQIVGDLEANVFASRFASGLGRQNLRLSEEKKLVGIGRAGAMRAGLGDILRHRKKA